MFLINWTCYGALTGHLTWTGEIKASNATIYWHDKEVNFRKSCWIVPPPIYDESLLCKLNNTYLFPGWIYFHYENSAETEVGRRTVDVGWKETPWCWSPGMQHARGLARLAPNQMLSPPRHPRRLLLSTLPFSFSSPARETGEPPSPLPLPGSALALPRPPDRRHSFPPLLLLLLAGCCSRNLE